MSKLQCDIHAGFLMVTSFGAVTYWSTRDQIKDASVTQDTVPTINTTVSCSLPLARTSVPVVTQSAIINQNEKL